MSRSRKNGSILLMLVLLLTACLSSGIFLYPEEGDASSQKNEPSSIVTSKSAPDSSHPIYYSDQVAVLTYHNLGSQETSTTISPQHFREHIQSLQKLGYNFVSLKQLSDFLDGQQSLPPNAVAITFDDGYASVYQYAFPILQAENIPAAVFVIVKNVGASQNQIPKLTWSQMQEMQVWGIEFFSHTYDSHLQVRQADGRSGPALTSRGYLPQAHREENALEYQDRILQDLLLAKGILEDNLHAEVNFLALPYGLQNDEVMHTARLAGYEYVFTVEPGLVKANSNHMALNRLNAGQGGFGTADLQKLILKYARTPSTLKAAK